MIVGVCIFLSIEKPRSESAFEAGIDSSSIISFVNEGNLRSPARVRIIPTLLPYQYLPTRRLLTLSAQYILLQWEDLIVKLHNQDIFLRVCQEKKHQIAQVVEIA